MKSMSITSSFFTKYFLSNQNQSDGSWCHIYDTNNIAKTIYTCQVIISLSYMPKTKSIRDSAKTAISFLLNTKTSNNLYDIYVKTNALSFWENLIPKDNLYKQLLRESSKQQEYGGRLNSFSFEQCIILETLINTNQLSNVTNKVRARTENLLQTYLKHSIDNINDISHFTWAVNLYCQLGYTLSKEVNDSLVKALNNYPKSNGLYELKASTGRPSKTPNLRSNEFLTAHLILGISRILQYSYSDKLYKTILDCVEIVVDYFHPNTLWSVSSDLKGFVKNDIYINALFFRALFEFSKISDDAFMQSFQRLNQLIKNYTQMRNDNPKSNSSEYYHVKLMNRIDSGEFKIDLSKDELMTRFVEPYLCGEKIIIKGTTIDPMKLWRIKIAKTDESIKPIVEKINQFDKASPSVFKEMPEWKAIDEAQDVTDEIIKGVPGSKKKYQKKQESTNSVGHIFIGHGRSKLWARLQVFLDKELKLQTHSFESESHTSESIIEILEEFLEKSSYAIIVLTAEDETTEGKIRARQNVVHEVGLFQGRLGFKNVIFLRQDKVEEFTNVAGLQYISFENDNIEQTFYELQRTLKKAGLIK